MTESTDGLAAFLAERLDEAEQNISYAGPARIAWLTYLRDDGQLAYTTVAAGDDNSPWCADGRELPEPASVRVVWDPARELRAIAAKREILRLHGPMSILPGHPMFNDAHLTTVPMRLCRSCEPETMWRRERSYPCRTLRQLGTEWNDHPAYLPEWSPEPAPAP